MRCFKSNDFIKNVISALKVTFKDDIKIFVEKIEKETPRYIFLYLTGSVNPNKAPTGDPKHYVVTAKNDLTLNILYRDDNGTMENLYEIKDKLFENLLTIQHLITKRAVIGLTYEVVADTKGIALVIRAKFNIMSEYSQKFDEDMVKELTIKINERKENG